MLQASKFIRLSEEYSVSQDVDVLSLSLLKAKGYRSVVNLRPDDENDRKLSSAKVKSISKFLNLDYRHFPVFGFEVTDQDTVRRFADLITTLPKPIVAYCRAGTRAAYLWASEQAMFGTISLESIEQIILAAGFDYSLISEELDEISRQTIELNHLHQSAIQEINSAELLV